MSKNGSFIEHMARKVGEDVDPKLFLETVKKQCFTGKAWAQKPPINEEVFAFLAVCNEHGLNPLTRELYPFRDKWGGMQNVIGVDGALKFYNRHPESDGIQVDEIDDDNGNLIKCVCTIWRKDRSHPCVIPERLDECQQPTENWKQKPRRMLRHKSVIQCVRYAFGLSNIMDEDEARNMPAPRDRQIEQYEEGVGPCNPHKIREALKMMGSTENEFRELAEIKLGKSTIEACTKAEAESVLEEIGKTVEVELEQVEANQVPDQEELPL